MKNIWAYLAVAVAVIVLALIFVVSPRAQAADIPMTWTAPADNVGVVKYDGRWSTAKPDTTSSTTKDAWWASATAITNMPNPMPAGTVQTVLVPGFNVGTYYFVVRSKDAAGNWSEWSNVSSKQVVDTQPPAKIVDLH